MVLEGHRATAWVVDVEYASAGRLLTANAGPPTTPEGEAIEWVTTSSTMALSWPGAARSVSARSGSTAVAIGGSPVRVMVGDVATEIAGSSGAAVFSPDGAWLAAERPGSTIGFHAAPGFELGPSVVVAGDEKAAVNRLAFSKDQSRFAVCRGQTGFGSPHGELTVFGFPAVSDPPVQLSCTCMDVTFVDSYLLAACWNYVALSDAGSPESAVALRWFDDSAISVAASESAFAVGSLGGDTAWFARDDFGAAAQPHHVLPVKGAAALAFAPDGATLAVGAWQDAQVYLWSP